MNVDDLKPFPVSRFGGMVDYQDPTKVINGCALLAQMVRFLPDQVGTCFGTVDTMKRPQSFEEVTGINVLDVLGSLNPGQVPILFGEDGDLLMESPAGSGALVEMTPPFPLPADSYMRATDAENTTTMAFSDGIKGLVPPLRYNGITKLLSTPQNPIGGLWSKSLIYQVGDLVRAADGRWWRCVLSATTFGSPTGPQWPQSNGYFVGTAWNPALALDPVGGSQWEEWTPNCAQFLPAPDVTGADIDDNPGAGTIAAGLDVYVKLTYVIPETGETPRSLAVSFINTAANDALTLSFGGGPTAGPFLPRWIAEINIQSGQFYPFLLNVYVASVATGSAAPADSAYETYAIEQSVGNPIQITSLTPLTPTGSVVTGATVTNGGFYIPPGNPLSWVISGGGGSGLQIRVNTRVVVVTPPSGPPHFIPGVYATIVTSITILNGGQGWASPPVITFSPGDPTATATFSIGTGPIPGGLFYPQGCSIALLNPPQQSSFIGEFGQRYMIVTRFNQNGSLAPVDPNSAIPVNFIGQLQLPIVNILRDGSGHVSCTVGDVTIGWAIGNEVEVAGCVGDATFNGTFKLTNVQPTLNPQGILSWTDANHASASNDQTGNVTLPAGPTPIAFIPPGGPNDAQDIVAFTVANPPLTAGGAQAGPFFFVTEAPTPPYSSPIVAMEGALSLNFSGISLTRDAGGFVTATLGDIAGIEVGDLVTVSKATDSSFDGQFSISGVSPGTGAGGDLTWEQPDDNASSATASLNIQIGEASSLQITVEDASGFQAGDVCLPLGVPAGFGGQVTIATIAGNVITVSSLATGTATISPGAILQRLQSLPSCAPAAPQNILSISRDFNGNVQAAVGNVFGYAAGQLVQVENVPTADLNGEFELLNVQTNADGVTGTLAWSQPGLLAESDTSGTGTVGGISDFPINYQDELLEDEEEVTNQLSTSPPPPAADVYFAPSLQMFIYTRGLDSLFLFSETGDAENIDLENGSLSVDDNSMSLAICVREARTGEIIAIKADSGYAVNPSDLPPAEWPCPNRWKEHGPPCAAAVGKGKDFLVFPSFWSQAGCYLYMNGTLDWLTKEFQKVWDRVNKDALNTIWTIVDEQEKEVQIGVPLDGATTPSHIVVGSYIEGWGPQEVLNRYGKLITARSAIRWSIRPRAVRSAAVVQRALTAPQPSLSQPYQFSSIARVGGLVTGSYIGTFPAPVIADFLLVDHRLTNGITRYAGIVFAYVEGQLTFEVGDTIPVAGVSDSSFDGNFEVLSISPGPTGFSNVTWAQNGPNARSGNGTAGAAENLVVPPVQIPGGLIVVSGAPDPSFNGQFEAISSTASTLSWLQNPGPSIPVGSWSYAAGIATFVFPGTIPSGLAVFPNVYVRGTGFGLDGAAYLVTSIVQGPGFFTVKVAAALGPGPNSGVNGVCQFFSPPADSAPAGTGNSYVASLVPTPTTDERIQTRQVLLAPSGPDPVDSVPIVSADRRTGLRNDNTVGGVITFRFQGPLDGDVSTVIVSGMDDPSFDGVYDVPTSASWGSDGLHNILQFETSGDTGVAYGGVLQSILPCLRVVMQDPTRLDDNGSGLDSSYVPAFAQAGNLVVVRWGAFNVQLGGNGTIQLMPQTEDPDAEFEPEEIVVNSEKPKRLQVGLRVPDNEYLTLGVSNKNIPGQGFILQELVLYGVPIFSGRRA